MRKANLGPKLLSLFGLLTVSALLLPGLSYGKDTFRIPKDTKAPWPVLILIHDYWGLDPFIKREVDRYAELGYYTHAVDLFSGAQPSTAMEAERAKEKLETGDALKRINTVLNKLLKNKNLDRGRLGIIGWGLGGGIALRAALENADIRTVVSIYGQPVVDVAELKKTKARIFSVFAENDSATPSKTINVFRNALNEAHNTFEIKVVPGVRRGFFDYTRMENYDPKASEEIRKVLVSFLAKHLALTDYMK